MKIIIIFLLIKLVAVSQTLKILGVFSFCAHSHYTLGYRLVKELADRGHNVTFINCFPLKKPTKNIREISVEKSLKPTLEYLKGLEAFGQYSYGAQLEWVLGLGLLYTNEVFQTKDVQDFLNSNEKFDLVITEHFVNDAMAIFHYKFKCPVIFLTPGPMTIFNNHLVGNPAPPSYIANLISNYGSNMSFWQRLQNTYRHIYGELFVHLRMVPEHNKLMKTYFQDAPELTSILYNASLLLTTSHISLIDPAPLQPNIKEIGGYHIFPPKPLSEDIKTFLDEAKEGVVLFSMGSNLRSSNFQPEKKKAILNAFSKIKQKVLWKFETDLPEKSENIKILNWIPQQDVMAHPNVIAFISHGGLLGTIEAIYHGLPILGLPVFWDQVKNIEDAAQKGFAIRLNYQNLNEEMFTNALNEILNNPSYRRNAKERSYIMHDQPLSHLDNALFWIEYVVRHKGAPHLKSIAVQLTWYQRYLVDILVFVVTVLTLLLLVIIYIIKSLLKLNNNKTNKRKKN